MCCETIVEATEDTEGQEALFCEGTCQKWLHRWCAGVHKESYAALTLSVEPFMCPSCRLSEHCQLIKTLVETVESLKGEVQQLKQCKLFPPTHGNPDVAGKDHDQEASSVNVSGVESGLETEPAPSKAVTNNGASAERSWATVVGRRGNQQRSRSGRRGGKRGNSNRAGSHRNYRTHQDGVNQSQGSGYETGERNIRPGAEPHRSRSQDRGERVQVQGKRRIWGTLKACSSNAAMQTICQLTGTSKEKLQIKRKFKRLHDNKTRWWHIVSGDEGDLDKLEGEWEAVRLQMGWKLEKYFVDGNFLRNGDSPPT